MVRAFILAALLASATLGLPAAAQAPDPAGPDVQPTPRADCGPGSNPETGVQGRVPRSEVESGRALQGYTCNAVGLSRVGDTGGQGRALRRPLRP